MLAKAASAGDKFGPIAAAPDSGGEGPQAVIAASVAATIPGPPTCAPMF